MIVVSGEGGRQAFFGAKGLDLTEGFRILSGAVSIPIFSRTVAQLPGCLVNADTKSVPCTDMTDSQRERSYDRSADSAYCCDSQASSRRSAGWAPEHL